MGEKGLCRNDELWKNFGSLIKNPDAVYISGEDLIKVSEGSCDTDKIALMSGDGFVILSSKSVGEEWEIDFERAGKIDTEKFPYEVECRGACLVFDEFLRSDGGVTEGLRFLFGDVFLFIFATDGSLIMTKSGCELFGEMGDAIPEREEKLIIKKSR